MPDPVSGLLLAYREIKVANQTLLLPQFGVGFDFSSIAQGANDRDVTVVTNEDLTFRAILFSSTVMGRNELVSWPKGQLIFREIGTSLLRPNPNVIPRNFGLRGYTFDDPARVFR